MLNPCGEIHCLGGRQAGGARVSHLAQAGGQAGRHASRHASRLAGRQLWWEGKARQAAINPPFLLEGRV